MKRYKEPWRPDLNGQAKEGFDRVKEEEIEKKFGEKVEFNLEKWTKLKLELKPEGSIRQAVDEKLYTADWRADVDAGRSPEAESEQKTESSISDLSGYDMAQAILADFNAQAGVEQDGGLEP